MSRRSLILATMLAAATVIGACGAPEPPFINRGLAYGEPCLPPCWEGLTPGVSTEAEARQTLERLHESGQLSRAVCSGHRCQISEGVEIWFEDSKVAMIHGAVYFDFELQQLIDLIGEPEAIIAYEPIGLPACRCEVTHAATPTPANVAELRTPIYYPQRGASFGVEIPPADYGCMCPYMRILGFVYLPATSSPRECDEYITRVQGWGRSDWDYAEWHGFGPGYVKE